MKKRGLVMLLAAILIVFLAVFVINIATVSRIEKKDAADSSNDAVGTDAADDNSGGAIGTNVDDENRTKTTGTIEYMTSKREDEEVFNEIVRDFKEETGIEVEITYSESTATILNRVATNDIPDLAVIYPTTVQDKTLIDEGIFMDLTEEPFLNEVNEKWTDLMKYEGKVYAVPVTVNAGVLYYNTDIFEQYALEEPQTIEELFEICEVLQENGIAPFAFQFKNPSELERQFFDRIWCGAVDHEIWNVLNEVGKEGGSFGDHPEIIDALEKILKLTEYTDVDPLTVDNNVLYSLFANGDIAMMATGTWAPSSVDQINPDVNYKGIVFPTISGVDPYVCGNTDMAIAISSTTDRPDDCKKFIEYLLREDVANKFYEYDRCPNVVNSVNFDIPEQNEINAMINSAEFVLLPTCYWPASYVSLFQPVLQGFFMDKEVDAFIRDWDEITREAYLSETE